MDCPKCHRRLNDCSKCGGRGGISDFGNKVNCRACNATGRVCNQHGGNWK